MSKGAIISIAVDKQVVDIFSVIDSKCKSKSYRDANQTVQIILSETKAYFDMRFC